MPQYLLLKFSIMHFWKTHQLWICPLEFSHSHILACKDAFPAILLIHKCYMQHDALVHGQKLLQVIILYILEHNSMRLIIK